MKPFITRLLMGAVTLLGVAPHPSFAQLAPVGAHHAGLGPDIGGGGGYSAAVPLDLPAARGGLPLPLSIVHGGARVGAAGRSWDVPLSFVYEDTSFAHRRPLPGADGVPTAPLRVRLSLLGQSMELVVQGDTWIPQHAPAGLTARRTANEWKVYDGAGRTFVFARRATDELWLLSRIEGDGQARVDLEYAVGKQYIDDPDIVSGGQTLGGSPGYTGVTIDLTGLRYNHSASGSAKHEVLLNYAFAQQKPLAVSVLGSAVLIRTRLLESIEVQSRATPGAALQTLRRYGLAYANDPDTQLKRLQAVTQTGQAGTPEAATLLPVAAYEYGSATTQGSAGAELRYTLAHTLTAPVAGVAPLAAAEKSGASLSVTPRLFEDVTGDGRADLVYPAGNGLTVARQRPGANGAPVLNDANLTGTFNDATMTEKHLGSLSTKKLPATYEDAHGNSYQTESVIDTFSEFRDVNGDGRPDLLVAADNYRWIAYINKPAANFAHNTQWVKRDYDMKPLADRLRQNGHVIDGTRLPLMRQRNGQEFDTHICWRNGQEVEIEQPVSSCNTSQVAQWLGEATATEWQLTDFNGDGSLDLALNTRPVSTTRYTDAPPNCGTCYFPGIRRYRLVPGQGNALEVVFNTNVFSAVPLSSPQTAPITVSDMNQPRWEHYNAIRVNADPGSEPGQIVGALQFADRAWADVNGDGLIDQVSWRSKVERSSDPSGYRPVYYLAAYLGTGKGISAAYIELPSHLSVFSNTREHQCASGSEFDARYSSQLRDITGDGIPDLVLAAARKVRIGTGSGFGALIPLSSTQLEISHTRNTCDGAASRTWAGLYEVDGDGRPEFVHTNAQGRYEVYQLAGSSGLRALSAGLLTAIDNGYGARTEISYTSAKDDGRTPHQLPHAEVVVSAVKVRQASNGNSAETRYAYGSPLFAFDPLAQRFRSFGYARSVALTQTEPGKGNATITDAYGLEPTFATDTLRWQRALKAGLTRDVTTLSGALADPWTLLGTNLTADTRRIAGSHRDYSGKFWSGGQPSQPGCDYIDDAYAATAVQGVFSAMNVCASRGFNFVAANDSWRGNDGPATDLNVKKHSQVQVIDDLGRVTQAYLGGDSRRDDDDTCVLVTYATAPANAYPRVLNAVARRTVTAAQADGKCGTLRLAAENFHYDNLPPGQVGAGRLTAHNVDRIAGGSRLEEIRTVDIDYNERGQSTVTTTSSGDGRTRVSRITGFDAFGLMGTQFQLEASGAQPQQISLTVDALTLLPTQATDANGLVSETRYDGFGRPRLNRVIRPDSGASGVVATTRYLGFEGQSGGRRILRKSFAMPVAEEDTATAPGHTTTVHLDDFGRSTLAMADLGSDYAKDLVVGATLYDPFGRVEFSADPFPEGQDAANAYGTTYLYNVDGTLKCAVRGRGPQAPITGLTLPTDESAERYPTCFLHGYRAGQEVVAVYGPDSLLAGSPQAGVFRETARSALGRPLTASTWSSTRLEHASYVNDRLGATTAVIRYKDPEAATPSQAVPWSFSYDSLGQLLRLGEPRTAARLYTYSHWGELLKVDTEQDPHLPAPSLAEVREYDGLGRLIRAEQRDGETLVPGTAYDYKYDLAEGAHAAVPTAYTLGRLTLARSDFATSYPGYDALGRTVAVAHKDPDGKFYVETAQYAVDGALLSQGALLPDTGERLEQLEYGYDSARRLTSVKFQHPSGSSSELYAVQEMDPLGRALKARIRGAQYTADYAPQGRRLLNSFTVDSASGKQWQLHMGGYDALGRERGRSELQNEVISATSYTYDKLGRLASSMRMGPSAVQAHQTFAYDALGNIRQQQDLLGNNDVEMSYSTDNRDRLCSVGYGMAPSANCDIVHDAFGRITGQPSPQGRRTLSYLPSGRTQRIETPTATATLRYGALGEVQELDVESAADRRRDRRYGPFELRSNGQGNETLTRTFAFAGIQASRRGDSEEWVFAFSEMRGTRLTLDGNGEFLQSMDYAPYGKIATAGLETHDPRYIREQWNGGDNLAAFGLSQLGARMYDPLLGRFLSPDPLLLPGTAQQINPYSFAYNDPVNASDPTGLTPETEPPTPLPQYEPFPTGCGFTMSCAQPQPRQAPRFTPAPPPPQPATGAHAKNLPGTPAYESQLAACGASRLCPMIAEMTDYREPVNLRHTPLVPLIWIGDAVDHVFDKVAGMATDLALAHTPYGDADRAALSAEIKPGVKFALDVGSTIVSGGASLLGKGGKVASLVDDAARAASSAGDDVVRAASSAVDDVARTGAPGSAASAPRLALPAPRQIEAAWGAKLYKTKERVRSQPNKVLMTGPEHIVYRHSYGHAWRKPVSRFNPSLTARMVEDYADYALRYGNVTPAGPNAYRVVSDMKQVIGTGINGQQTRFMEMFVEDGIITTMYPL